MDLDAHGQPINTNFNAGRNKEKALYGLKGILLGVTANEKLSEQELLFLDVWLRSQEFLRDDGDVVDLLDLITDILKDGHISNDELEELNCLIDDVIAYKPLYPAQDENQINELIGLVSGIAADNLIENSEINSLSEWLVINSNIADSWPARVLINRLNSILEDGVVTQDEREDLLETIKQITGIRFDESGFVNGMATEFFEDEVSLIDHEGACFCFTGAFVTGTRKAVEANAKDKGAITTKDVTKSTNYLVIGTLASRDWRFSSHGRKIEKALRLKENGMKICIVTERTWLRHL